MNSLSEMQIHAPWLLRLKARLAGLSEIDVALTTIGPIIITGDIEVGAAEIRHEQIHIRQWWELLGLGYVILFWWFFIWGRIKHGNTELAYVEHPLEREAYDHMANPDYLKTRKPYAWKTYC